MKKYLPKHIATHSNRLPIRSCHFSLLRRTTRVVYCIAESNEVVYRRGVLSISRPPRQTSVRNMSDYDSEDEEELELRRQLEELESKKVGL